MRTTLQERPDRYLLEEIGLKSTVAPLPVVGMESASTLNPAIHTVL